jgi:2-C-methyl-D-erythritol 4-phosphate cytidylyltransferase
LIQIGMQLCAVIVAGGTGTRLGAGMPKQMLPLQGRPILAHTLDRFLAYDPTLVTVTVLHASLYADWDAFITTHFPAEAHARLRACPGGAERTDSVQAGLQCLHTALGTDEALVAIHDAVRPFIDREMLDRGFSLAAIHGNATAAVPVKSSLRVLTPQGSQAIDRSQYFHVQTPQMFRLGEIIDCYLARDVQRVYTDDAGLAEDQGMHIQLFDGSYDNLKVTTLEDLLLAEQLMAQRGA